ncbi:MAG TPA: 23S rRNA (uracil(1939)-C(5))-methyltransferase RlmD [Casimicrobiaceae bacterium]|nr:23S rRNA (uracil(1939)-C(5))-methyltransferase RlmD [Casimicrobiaceae bacterium]
MPAGEPTSAVIESLDQEGRGIARIEGKAIFVEGALPGEEVTFVSHKRKPTYEIARVESVLRASAARVDPRCAHFGVCGGCTMQHFDATAQVAAKQRALEDTLWHIGRVRPAQILPAIHGPSWGYRYRARLSVRNVPKKGGVLVGFHERKSSYVADMIACSVLPPKISSMLPALRELVSRLSIRDRLPQIELAVGEDARTTDGTRPGEPLHVLVLRVLQPPSAQDEAALRAFAETHGVQLYLQPGGPATAQSFHPIGPELAYTLPEFGLVFPFSPTEFTQVNAAINRVLVRRTITLLDPQPGERMADFFCGLGNFTLPIARRGATVVGIEGSAELVRRANENARRNGLIERTRFATANLFEAPESIEALGPLDKVLIDPPREGAIAVVKALPGDGPPRRIVYVSCNPATLARDASVLVNGHGYELCAAGIINMFPHTGHVESMAVFERAA